MPSVALPPSGDVWAVLSQWRVDPWIVGGILAAASSYAAGIIRVRRIGGQPSSGRSVAFLGGVTCVGIALVSPVDAYAGVSFTVHMAQHLLLTLVAPPLLALGAPITLALRASSPRVRRLLVRVLRAPAVSFLARPVVGWMLFVGVPIVIHASPLFDAALRSQPVHALEHGLWLTAALVYWWPVVGADPSPHPMGYPARLLSLFLAMPAMSFLAVAIYQANAPLYPGYAGLPAPWGTGALGDQRGAAVLMWLAGNLAVVVAILVTAAAWKRDEDRDQSRREARQPAGRSTATASTL